jgi:hypothetical protein
MEYAQTAHNRSVYASPLLGNEGQRHRRDVARYVSANTQSNSGKKQGEATVFAKNK